MQGLVDGINTRFRTRKSPVKANTITVYVSNVAVAATLTPPDVMILGSAPAAQPYATYTHQPLSVLQAKQLMMDGVTELEIRWPRAWRMSSSAVTFAAADPSDTNIYVVSGNSMQDPSDNVALSTSENQRGIVVACAVYVYRMAQAFATAMAAVSVRGTAGGMTLDRKAIPSAMMNLLAMYDKRLRSHITQAAMEWTGGDSLGGTIGAIATRDYMQQYEWQTASKLHGWYSTYSFDPSDVDLMAIS